MFFFKSYMIGCYKRMIIMQSYITIRDVGIDLAVLIFFILHPLSPISTACAGTMMSEKWSRAVGRAIETSQGAFFQWLTVMPEIEPALESPFDGSTFDLHYKNRSLSKG